MSAKKELLDTMSSQHLPKFRNPPVVETVLGVQFDPLPKFGNAHLGAFWKRLDGDWPDVSDMPSLEPEFERFGEGKGWLAAGLKLKLSQSPESRLQIRNGSNDRMIQVQNGRLHYNWLGHEGKPYPSFEQVEPDFQRALAAFRQFLAQESLGELQPNQWEVTYVNHIPKGSVWNDPHDWVGLFPSLAALPPKASSVRL
ncbi:MAG: TIGR04255 family protein, partial [Planctomycetes bacterium]|nr:TIGR04255 family protein [Planctomycetota bacterium]